MTHVCDTRPQWVGELAKSQIHVIAYSLWNSEDDYKILRISSSWMNQLNVSAIVHNSRTSHGNVYLKIFKSFWINQLEVACDSKWFDYKSQCVRCIMIDHKIFCKLVLSVWIYYFPLYRQPTDPPKLAVAWFKNHFGRCVWMCSIPYRIRFPLLLVFEGKGLGI